MLASSPLLPAFQWFICFFYNAYPIFNFQSNLGPTSMLIRWNLGFNYTTASISQLHLTFLFLSTIAPALVSNGQVIPSLTSTCNLHNDRGDSLYPPKKSSRAEYRHSAFCQESLPLFRFRLQMRRRSFVMLAIYSLISDRFFS